MLPCISLPETLYLADLGLRNGVSQVHPFPTWAAWMQRALNCAWLRWRWSDFADEQWSTWSCSGSSRSLGRCAVHFSAQMCPDVPSGAPRWGSLWSDLRCTKTSMRSSLMPHRCYAVCSVWTPLEPPRILEICIMHIISCNNRAIPMHIMHVKEIWREISRSVFQVRFPGHAYGGSQALQSGQVDAVQIVWGWRGDGVTPLRFSARICSLCWKPYRALQLCSSHLGRYPEKFSGWPMICLIDFDRWKMMKDIMWWKMGLCWQCHLDHLVRLQDVYKKGVRRPFLCLSCALALVTKFKVETWKCHEMSRNVMIWQTWTASSSRKLFEVGNWSNWSNFHGLEKRWR